MRALVRTCLDARDIVAHLDALRAEDRDVDSEQLRLQAAFVLSDAEEAGLVVTSERERLIERMIAAVVLDGAFFEGVRGVLSLAVLSRVAACTVGFSALEVGIVRKVTPHLVSLVMIGALLEVQAIVLANLVGRPDVRARVTRGEAAAAWRRRQLFCERRLVEPDAYLDDQKSRVVKARREVRWARDRLKLLAAGSGDRG